MLQEQVIQQKMKHLLEDVVHVPDFDGPVDGGRDDRVPAADGQRLDVDDPGGISRLKCVIKN